MIGASGLLLKRILCLGILTVRKTKFRLFDKEMKLLFLLQDDGGIQVGIGPGLTKPADNGER
jgi:hypothetical protein